MRRSNMTNIHLRHLVLLSCSLLLITIACKKNDVPAAENSSSSKQVEEKITVKKDVATKSSDMVVEVNDTKLTQGEVEAKISKVLESLKGRFPQDQKEKVTLDLREKIIEGFITRTILTQEAGKNNIIASNDEINLEIKKFEKQLPQGITLETALKQGGVNMEEMRKDVAFSVLANKLIESQIKNNLAPSDEEIKKYYTDNKKKFGTPETVHARHILLKVDDKDDEKTKDGKMAKIEGIRKQLLEGADFEKLAKEQSDCPSKEKGGDLGTFPRGRMAKPFEVAAFSQKANEIGPIVQTQFGNHIIQVLEHNEATSKPIDEVKENIREILKQQKKQEIAKSYLAKLREKAKIVYGTTDIPKK